MRDSDGDGKLFLYVSDVTTPNVQIYSSANNERVFVVSRGLLESVKSDDEVVQAMAQELEHQISPGRKKSRQPNAGLMDRLASNAVGHIEADHLGITRVIEQGRNPWAAIDLYEHIDEAVKSRSSRARGGGGIGTEARIDGISANLVGRIRALGELSKFRIRETAVSRSEVIGSGQSSVFQTNEYAETRKQALLDFIRNNDSGTARVAYLPLGKFNPAKPAEMISFPDPDDQMKHWFNYDARTTWETVSEMLPAKLSTAEKLDWQTRINESLGATWEILRKAFVDGNKVAKTPEGYVYLADADQRKFLVALPNPIVERAYLLRHRERLADLRARAQGAEGKSTERKAALEAEIRIVERRERTALERFNDAISPYQADGTNSKTLEQAIAKLDENLANHSHFIENVEDGPSALIDLRPKVSRLRCFL